MRKVIATGIMMSMIACALAGCGSNASSETKSTTESADVVAVESEKVSKRTYYYVAPYQSIPYCVDMHYGFEYAVNQLDGAVEMYCIGPDDGDTDAAADALEQVIAKNPDGIIVACWDNNMNAAVEKARAAGIPVVCVESYSDVDYDFYIGLDNYTTGQETGEQLVKYAGDSGKLLVIGNWGSTNIDDKLRGLEDYLAAYPGWQVLGTEDGDCDTETSIQAASNLLTKYGSEVTAFVGLDSACGGAIATAMEEQGYDAGSMTVICADREDAMIEYIKNGYITASLCGQTASMCSFAVMYLEMLNAYDLNQAPVTADNEAAGISVLPDRFYTQNVVITKDNADLFLHENIDDSAFATEFYGK